MGPCWQKTPKSTKAGKATNPPVWQEPIPDHQCEKDAKTDEKIDKGHDDRRDRHDQPGKIDFADQFFVVDQAVGGFAKTG